MKSRFDEKVEGLPDPNDWKDWKKGNPLTPKSNMIKKMCEEKGIPIVEHKMTPCNSEDLAGRPEIRQDAESNIDDKYVDYLNENHTGLALKEALEEYYVSIGVGARKIYRIDIRPLWKNNSPNIFALLAQDVMNLLRKEFGADVWWEETTKALKFRAPEHMSMKTIIALQAIGHNNGGYMLGISIVL